MYFGDIYPHNLIACGILSGFMGWSLGPTIGYIGERFKWKKFLKDKGVKRKDINNKSGFWGANDNRHYVYYYEGDEDNYFELKSDKMRELEDDFNKNILEEIQNKKFDNNKFKEMGGYSIQYLTLKSINDNSTFEENSVKILYSLPLNSFTLVKDYQDKIYLVKLVASKKNTFNKKDENFIEFTKNQNTNTRKSILQSYDQLLNNKYKVQLNQKTIERVKEYFK